MFIALLKKETHKWIARAINVEKTIDVTISNLSIPFSLWEIVTYKNKKYRIISVGDEYEIQNLNNEEEILTVSLNKLTSDKKPIREDAYFLEEIIEKKTNKSGEIVDYSKFIISETIPSFNTRNICKDLIYNDFKSIETKDLIQDLLMFKCFSETKDNDFYINSKQVITYGNYSITKPY